MASSSDDATLTISIPGWTEVSGHTEYIIKTNIGDHHFAVQHRFSNFIDLHEALAAKLSKLPATFPIAKSVFNGESVKKDRVERLQKYMKDVIKLCEDSNVRPLPAAMLKFLHVDAKVFAPAGGSGATGDAGGGNGGFGGACGESPLGEFAPFGTHFVPEKPEDVNEGLREAIKAGDVGLCLELIENKADPNYRDRQGNTPLHMAALFQRTGVAKALLLAGADLTLKNGAGELPERMASVSLKMKFQTFKSTGQVCAARARHLPFPAHLSPLSPLSPLTALTAHFSAHFSTHFSAPHPPRRSDLDLAVLRFHHVSPIAGAICFYLAGSSWGRGRVWWWLHLAETH